MSSKDGRPGQHLARLSHSRGGYGGVVSFRVAGAARSETKSPARG